jgi:hypothetical protein
LQLAGHSWCLNRLGFALYWQQGFGGYGAKSDGFDNKADFLNEALTHPFPLGSSASERSRL